MQKEKQQFSKKTKGNYEYKASFSTNELDLLLIMLNQYASITIKSGQSEADK